MVLSSDVSGYLVHAEPYCGSETILEETGFGYGGDVVIGLIKKCVLLEGCTITFDNLFTSLLFLDELSELRIGGFGTLRQNRLQNAPVLSKLLLKREDRGAYDFTRNNRET